MEEYEQRWDQILRIHTVGRDDSAEDQSHFPYEPTPYIVLERLAESGWIQREDTVVDYGCGKGRVGIFLSEKIGCQVIGIEFHQQIYQDAVKNTAACRYPGRCRIVQAEAGAYLVNDDADCFFFFNPFPVEVLRLVMEQIRDSWYRSPRQMKLFFYYPSDEYVAYLMTVDLVEFLDEIDCGDLFEGKDSRERILICRIDF